MEKEPNKYVAALKDEFHLVGMAALFATCAVTAPIVFPFVALPLEAAYLLFAPDSAWLKNRLARKQEADAERKRQQMRRQILPTLALQDQVRFNSLEAARAEIERQESPTLGSWYRQVVRQLDYLMEKFLLFASKKMEYRRYIVNLAFTRARLEGRQVRLTIPELPGDSFHPERVAERAARDTDIEMLLASILDDYDREIRQADREIQQEKDPQTQAILKTNREVLRRSRESADRLGRLLRNLEHQLELVVNTFDLINSQVRSSRPEQILEDVNAVVDQSENLTETLATFAPMDEALARLERINES